MNGFMENIKLKAVVREYEQGKFEQTQHCSEAQADWLRGVSATQWSWICNKWSL